MPGSAGLDDLVRELVSLDVAIGLAELEGAVRQIAGPEFDLTPLADLPGCEAFAPAT